PLSDNELRRKTPLTGISRNLAVSNGVTLGQGTSMSMIRDLHPVAEDGEADDDFVFAVVELQPPLRNVHLGTAGGQGEAGLYGITLRGMEQHHLIRSRGRYERL